MVVSGLEIVALVMAIISGINAADDLIKSMKARLQKEKGSQSATAIQRLDTVRKSTINGRDDVQREYESYCRNLGNKYSHGDDIAKLGLQAALDIQRMIISRLRSAQSSTQFVMSDWRTFELASNRCQTQTLDTLNQLYQRLALAPRKTPLMRNPGSDMRRRRNYPPDLCQSAITYRDNRAEFAELAHPKSATQNSEWSCNSCRKLFSPVSLSTPNATLWISVSSLLKAHCGNDGGWMCIWENPTPECIRQFTTRKELIQHMKGAHVTPIELGHDVKVDRPLDLRQNDVYSCGYGITIQGRGMIRVGSDFIVPKTE